MAFQYLAFCPVGFGNLYPNCPQTTTKNEEPTISNSTVCDHWCGKWSTKEEALNSLFSLYRRRTGKIIRWYVDWEGYLEWFEIGLKKGIEYVYDTDGVLFDYESTSSCSSVVNRLTGTYGQDDGAGTVTLENTASITKYGLSVGQDVNNICMDETEMTAYLQHLLDIQSIPTHSAKATFPGLKLTEPGKQFMFPDEVYHGDKVWTVVDLDFGDEGGKPVTTLNLTTDETVISIPNEFEIIQSTAQNEVEKSLPEAATVTAVLDNNNLLVTKEKDGSTAIVRSLSTGS